jgi:excisionase family DNA binding protein
VPAKSPQSPRRWVSLSVAADHLAVSQKTLRRMIAAGHVRGYRVGSRLVRVDLNELDAMASPIPTGGAA